ncbi:MAG: AAA family ATPase [Nitrosopumilus sp.]
MTKLELNDRVIISEDSEYWGAPMPSNPRDVIGTVTNINVENLGYPLRVEWDNGHSNSYDYCDLELVVDEHKVDKPEDTKKCIIFDLDGTLRDPGHRLHLVKNGSRQYDEFNMACGDDPIVPNIAMLYEMLANAIVTVPFGSYDDIEIFVFSGCSDIAKETTENWMKEHNLTYNRLWMRPADDHQKDVELKRSWLHKIQAEGYEVLFTVDDRQSVVDMWRSEGITCLQCNQWDEDPDKDVEVGTGSLYVLVGPSGAGKTYWVANVREGFDFTGDERFVHISSDKIREGLCGDFQDQSRNKEVFDIFHADIKHNLKMGRTVYADATHLTARARKKTVACAPKGCEITYHIIDRSLTQKILSGGWRNDVILKDGETLIENHHNRFKSAVKYALTGDGDSSIRVVDYRST